MPRPWRVVAMIRDVRAAAKDRVDEPGGRLDDVLAVVEYDERAPRLERVDDRLGHRPVSPFADVEYRRDRVRDEIIVRQRRELDEPDAVLVPVEQIGAHLQREARLADAARADERDEPVLGEQLRDGEDVDVAADEARDLKRQVVRQRFERAQRREIRRESGRYELVDLLGMRQIFETVLAEIAERGPRRQLALG